MSELDLTNIASTSINTPTNGVTAQFIDSSGGVPAWKDSTGYIRSLGRTNYSTVVQTPAASTRTYLIGSALAIPKGKIQTGTMFRWRFNMTKTAFGSATSTFDVCFGTAGSISDTARVSFTKPAGTAAIDEAWVDIIVTIRVNGASGVAVGEFVMSHNGNTAGHATIPIVVVNTISSAFDMTVADLIAGVCITPGAADVISVQVVQAETLNL